jgi:transposase InsO family protein
MERNRLEKYFSKPYYPIQDWAIDFQLDQTMDGRTLKFMNVLDEYSRVCLAIRVGRRCQTDDVIDTIEELLKLYPAPTPCSLAEFASSLWCPFSGVPSCQLVATS